MNDWLQAHDVEEVNVGHINGKNSDGHSTIFLFKKKDGSQMQVTAFGHKQDKIKHTMDFKEEDMFNEMREWIDFVKQVFEHLNGMSTHNEAEDVLFNQAEQILEEHDDLLRD